MRGFAEDQKVKFDNKHNYYIFNTDKASGAGIHWIAVYVDHSNKTAYVFDTFDRETSKLVPDLYLDIKNNHLRVRKSAHTHHQKDCQSSCGQRSLAYLILVKRNGVQKILNQVSERTQLENFRI